MNAALPPFQRYLLACAVAAGCSVAVALTPPIPDVRRMSSAQLRTVDLECDRLASQAILAPDEMILCALVADVLLQRDFGGVPERQLRWRRQAQVRFTAPVAVPESAGSAAMGGQASGNQEP